MEIIKSYRHNKALRDSFNALAEATFGLNFENWYQMGYWGDNYNPYSILQDGKIVANVSLNRTDMVIGGQRKRLYQLGTVMTYPEYRNRGLIREIMAEIEKDTVDADGIYLFGNDNVVAFYPKFGFVPGKEYLYTKEVAQTGEMLLKDVPMGEKKNRDALAAAMAENTFRTGCTMAGNPELIFFYVAQFMQENVYYWEEKDTWVIAEQEEGNLLLHNVFSKEQVTLDEVIGAFGTEVKTVTLGFAPENSEGFTATEYHEEDCNFFVKGDVFTDQKLRIPSLSHA